MTANRHYVLVCQSCGKRHVDDGLILDCTGDHAPALLCTEYDTSDFTPRRERSGLFRYVDWLPVVRARDDAGRTAVYRSEGLASALGLEELWIAFNGYWPERGAGLGTATFKEFEAYTVLGRMPDRPVTLTVASSGNTGAAFAWACSQTGRPCLIITPAKALPRFRFPGALDPCVRLVAIEDGEYPDAIDLAAAVTRISPLQAEGGVQNVGRRDGLATVMLSAFEEIQRLPTHYFQAVGSGTGAIAVLEAAKRLAAAAGDDPKLPRLMLCQNTPFSPIHDAWQTDRHLFDFGPTDHLRDAISRVHADELTNWAPPYAIPGGVHDSLTESKGTVLIAGNDAVHRARAMFRELEGTDVEPAVGVAIACLRDAVDKEEVGRDATVLLNVTGGGRERLEADRRLIPAAVRLRLTRSMLALEETAHRVADLCA